VRATRLARTNLNGPLDFGVAIEQRHQGALPAQVRLGEGAKPGSRPHFTSVPEDLLNAPDEDWPSNQEHEHRA